MEDRIEKWLSESGYPLELYISSELKRRGYMCGKSELFVDIETEKKREIDVTGYHFGDFDSDIYYCARRLIFECKKSEKPLLNLCASDEMKSRFYHHAFHGDPEDLAKPDALAYTKYDKSEDDHKLIGGFSGKSPLGYSLVPAFGKSDQDIYSGLMGLIKASTYYRRLFSEFKNEIRNDLTLHLQDRNYFEFHVAAMVVDAPLFDVFLADDGSTNIKRSEWSLIRTQLPWNFNPHDSSEGYCLHVVTKAGFPDFLDSIEKLHAYSYSAENIDFLLDKRPKKEQGVFSKGMKKLNDHVRNILHT